MITLILTHEVKDFPAWKEIYDAGEPFRTKSGIKMTGVYSSVDNPNHVTLIGECANLETLHGFMNNPQLKADMEKAGVVSKPEFKVFNKV